MCPHGSCDVNTAAAWTAARVRRNERISKRWAGQERERFPTTGTIRTWTHATPWRATRSMTRME